MCKDTSSTASLEDKPISNISNMRISQFRLFTFTASCPEVGVSRINTAHLFPSKAPAAWERRGSGSRGYETHSLGVKSVLCFQAVLFMMQTYHFSPTLKLCRVIYLGWRCVTVAALTDREHLGHVIVLCEVSKFEYTCKYSNPLDKCQYLWAAPKHCDRGIQVRIGFYCTGNVFCVAERIWGLRDIHLFYIVEL